MDTSLKPDFLFTSLRLGFRNWTLEDLDQMAAINRDPGVMEFFPFHPTRDQTLSFFQRMQEQYNRLGYCYFAVDTLDRGELIGFIGLSITSFESGFTPCTDIGWRLARAHWGKGYATEGARRCLAHGFDDLGLEEITSIAPVVNTRSIRVMEKIGMNRVRTFLHPMLKGDALLEECVLYAKRRNAERPIG